MDEKSWNHVDEAIAKDACGGYEKLKADIAEKEKMLAEIKQEQAAAISDLERGIKEEMYTECKREYDKQSTRLRIMELALSRVSDSDARAAVRQFYFERIPSTSVAAPSIKAPPRITTASKSSRKAATQLMTASPLTTGRRPESRSSMRSGLQNLVTIMAPVCRVGTVRC